MEKDLKRFKGSDLMKCSNEEPFKETWSRNCSDVAMKKYL